jgi:hypothetical protein
VLQTLGERNGGARERGRRQRWAAPFKGGRDGEQRRGVRSEGIHTEGGGGGPGGLQDVRAAVGAAPIAMLCEKSREAGVWARGPLWASRRGLGPENNALFYLFKKNQINFN